MSQSEETPTDSTLHLGLHSPDSDPTPDPNPSPSDLNHSAEETEHDGSNLGEQLQNLDLEEEEAEKKDDGERESDNDSRADVAEERRPGGGNDNGIDGENVKQNEGGWSQYLERPEAEDCAYYMKTGNCKFGSNCKFNHPVRIKNHVFFSPYHLYMCSECSSFS